MRARGKNWERGGGGGRWGRAKSEALVGRAPRWWWGWGGKEAERRGGGGWGWGGEKGDGVGGSGIVTRELKVLLRSSLSPSNLHWS